MSSKTKRGFNHILRMRRNRRLLQKQLALLLGHRYTAQLSKYESGRALPPLETALLIEVALGIRLQDLYPDLYQDLQVMILKRAEGLPADLRRSILGRLHGKDDYGHT